MDNLPETDDPLPRPHTNNSSLDVRAAVTYEPHAVLVMKRSLSGVNDSASGAWRGVGCDRSGVLEFTAYPRSPWPPNPHVSSPRMEHAVSSVSASSSSSVMWHSCPRKVARGVSFILLVMCSSALLARSQRTASSFVRVHAWCSGVSALMLCASIPKRSK
jgi:hypothetical protein